MDAALHDYVTNRANGCCEYCHFPASFSELPFQIDHIVARQHGGKATAENLALACCWCNRYKGPNLSGIDPVTEFVVCLFHPRTQMWDTHFTWRGALIVGKTDVGRATVQTLNLNRADAVAVRALLMTEGVYPV
jgi:hypothetical protein